MERFTYSKLTAFVSIIFPVILMAGLFIWSFYEIWMKEASTIAHLLIVTMPILLLFSVIGINNPTSVTLTADFIKFEGFGRTHQYNWNELQDIHVKNYGYVGKSFIKIGGYRLLGGRYWVSSSLRGYNELIGYLQNKKLS